MKTSDESKEPRVGMDPVTLLQQFAFQMRSYAKEAGTSCDLPGCTALTLGFRCDKCSRRLCVGHAYWRLTLKTAVPHCPYCVVQQSNDLFLDDDATQDTE